MWGRVEGDCGRYVVEGGDGGLGPAVPAGWGFGQPLIKVRIFFRYE